MRKAILMMLLLCLLTSSSLAAEFSYRDTDNTMLIEGMIVGGDADRMYRQLIKRGSPTFIQLDSPGGNVEEALKMASLISGMKVEIYPRQNGICASSCFFLFLAGEPRKAEGRGGLNTGRFGKVGLHRPYMSKQFFNSVDSEKASKTQMILMKSVGAYLESNMVPRQLIEMMMNRPSTEVYWLTDKDIASLGEYSPAREELFAARCGYSRNTSDIRIMLEVSKDMGWGNQIDDSIERVRTAHKMTTSCIFDIQGEERNAIFHRLIRTGWKPWMEDQRGKKSAAEKWIEIDRNEDYVFYADTAIIRKRGNIVEMWSLVDFKTARQIAGEKSVLSIMSQEEYDCKEGRIRSLYMSSHSANMAGGKVVSSGVYWPSKEWERIQRGANANWQSACGKQ